MLAQVLAVEQDAALGGLVEAREQLDERRLAGAVLADQREALAARDEDVDIAQRPVFLARVAEADALEADAELAAVAVRAPCRLRQQSPRARGWASPMPDFSAAVPSRNANRFDM